jgi:hypothetical protein
MMYFSLLLIALASCSSENLFSDVQEQDTAQEAITLLEQEKVDKAIILLEKELAKKPEDYQLWSILASAYAQKAGIDIIRIALALGTDDTNLTNTNPLLELWPALPVATGETIELVQTSMDILERIPTEQKIKADTFKETFIGMAGSSLMLKLLDVNQDGELSLEEIGGLSEELAVAVLGVLLQASLGAIDLMANDGEDSASAAQKVGDSYNNIQNQSGTSQSEKLSQYLNP